MASYVPDRGDIIWLDFNPQSGSEICKRRPALVLSPKLYNKRARLCLVCPISSKVKGHPFEVEIATTRIQGAIKSDQVKSMDWSTRKAAFVERASALVMDEVLARVEVLLFEG